LTSSIYPLDFVVSTGVASFTNLVGGSGYTIIPIVTISPPDNKDGIQATATASIGAGAVTAVNIATTGSGYINIPTVTIADPDTAGTTATVDAVLETIAIDDNILSVPITIIPIHVKPGGGGIVRLYFSFTTSDAANTNISVFNNSVFKGFLNADNGKEIISDGYYRFDIDVENGDIINLQSTLKSISKINLFRAHLVQFGA